MAFILVVAPSTAFANCIGDRALSADEIARFKSDPALYVSGTSERELEILSERIVASDGSTLDGFRKAIAEKPLPEQTAITVGLARAAQACSTVDPAQARLIQLVAADLSPTLRTAFERTTGQREVALTGGASGAGSSGAAGGPTDLTGVTSSNGGSDSPTEWSVANGPTRFTFSGSSGSSIERVSSTTTIINSASGTAPIVATPVSP